MHQRLLFLLLFALPWALPAQQSTNLRVLARAELSRADITIGDQVWLEVNISAPPGTEVAPLPAGALDDAKGVEIVSENPLNTVAEAPELLIQQRLLVTSFDSGHFFIPPLPYVYRAADGRQDTAYTNDLLLRVNMLPVGEDDELRPIKDIITESLNLYDFWPVLLLLVLGLIGFVTYRRFRASKRTTPPPPPPPADLQALNDLRELERAELWQKGDTKGYYSQLTRIFRTYLTARYDIPAMEMTSRQINKALEDKSRLSADQRGELRQLLQLSDLVKFAKATPAADLHVTGLERVRTFVRTTGPEAPVPASLTFIAPATAPALKGEGGQTARQQETTVGESTVADPKNEEE